MIKPALALLLLAMHPSEGQAIDIYGAVKTESGNPIAGAHVLVKNANLSDTTDADGAFRLLSPGSHIVPGAGSHPGSRLAAGLQGGVLSIAASRGSRVSLRVFSQLGQELFTGAYPAAAGVKTVVIPGLGTEKVIVRIQSGAHSLALQGHAKQGTIQAKISATNPASLEKGSATIPDSLVVTKDGFLRRAVQLATSITSGLEIRMTGSTGGTPTSGIFRVALFPGNGSSAGYTGLVGAVYGAPKPVPQVWQEAGKSGGCRLLIPRVNSCEIPCGSTAVCVADKTCRDYPPLVSAGTMTAKGINTSQGASQFALAPSLLTYFAPSQLAYPPFAEGDDVSISAFGDSGFSPFSIPTKGIGPLVVLTDSILLAEGQPLLLEWVPPSLPGGTALFILLDLSHHGGTKGKIECEVPDNGRMEIAASLVDQLKALGVSGFPKAEITRQRIVSDAESGVDLVLESPVHLPVSVPGLISCSNDADCTSGQACQADMQCK